MLWVGVLWAENGHELCIGYQTICMWPRLYVYTVCPSWQSRCAYGFIDLNLCGTWIIVFTVLSPSPRVRTPSLPKACYRPSSSPMAHPRGLGYGGNYWLGNGKRRVEAK